MIKKSTWILPFGILLCLTLNVRVSADTADDCISRLSELITSISENKVLYKFESPWQFDSNEQLASSLTQENFDATLTDAETVRVLKQNFSSILDNECERQEYRSKLKSLFDDIDQFHSEIGTTSFYDTLSSYVISKISSKVLSEAQSKMPFNISITKSVDHITYTLNSACGFSVELKKIKTED